MADMQGHTEKLDQKAVVHYEVSLLIFIALHFNLTGIFSSRFESIIRTQSQWQITSFSQLLTIGHVYVYSKQKLSFESI